MAEMEKQETTAKPLDFASKLVSIIKALDENEMTKRRGINFSAEFLAEKVAEAKAKYPKLQAHPDSLVKGAMLEVIKDSAVNNFLI